MRTSARVFLALTCGLFLAACGKSQSHAPTLSPSPPPPGGLEVEVNGLPAGVDANILLMAPNDTTQHLAGSQTLTSLSPGQYKLEVFPVSTNTTGYLPASSEVTVTISADAGAQADIGYTELPTQLTPQAVQADASTGQSLAKVDKNGTASTLTFSQMTPQLMALKPGSVLAFAKTAATPNGFLGRVTSVNGLTISTEQAQLTDFMQQGVIAFHKEETDADVVKVTPLMPNLHRIAPEELARRGELPVLRGSGGGMTCLTADHSWTSGGSAGVALSVNGSICFQANLDMGLRIVSTDPGLNAGISGSIVTNFSVSGLAYLSLSASIPIFEVQFGSFGVGPVEIVPILTFYLKADGSIEAGITTGVTDTFGYAAGFSAYKKEGVSSYSSVSNQFSFQYPKPTATATVKVAAGPELSFEIDEIAGPEFGIDGYAELDVDFLNTPLWSLHAGIELNAGIGALAGFANLNWNIFTKDWTLLTASDKPPANLERFRFAAGTIVGPPAIESDGTVIVASAGGQVLALSPDGAKKWSYVPDTQIFGEPVIGPDGTIYVNATDSVGHNPALYAIHADGTLKWSVPTTNILGGPSVGSDGTIYDANSGAVEARNPADGSIRWTTTVTTDSLSTAPIILANGDLLVGGFDGFLTRLTAAGALVWHKAAGSFGLSTPALSPDGSTAYVSSLETLIAVSTADGTVTWSRQFGGGEQAAPPVVGPDGTIYLGSIDKSLVAFTPAGVKKWSYATGGLIKGAAVIGNDGNIYVGASDGNLYGVSPAGQLLWMKPTLGDNTSSATMDGKGAVLVGGECPGTDPSQCGVTAIFTDASGIATSGWPKELGPVTNSGT